MANREDFKLSTSQKRRRRFSENFKREKVRELEQGYVRVVELCKLYDVSSAAVYKWIAKFGTGKDEKEWLMVESKSDTQELLKLRKQVAELERVLGQKQILLDFQEKMIELAEQHYGIDIKKNSSTQAFNQSGIKEKKKDTV